MGVISRYFKRLSGLLRPGGATAPAVSADVEGLRIGGEQVAWSDLRRSEAYKPDIYAGDFLCLAIVAAGGRVFEINEASPGWKEAGEALERFLPGSQPHAEWTLRLIGGKSGKSVAIYPVDTFPLKRTGSR